MNDIVQELDRVIEVLTVAGIDYALCGGLAVGIHGHPRMTQDIDLLVLPASVDPILELVKQLGFDIPSRKMIFGLKQGAPRPIQRVSKLIEGTSELLSLDLLHAVGDLDEVWADRQRYEWRGREIRVVSVAGLVKMKRIAGRPRDLQDIEMLEGRGNDEDT